jgi:acyl-CoA thioesterase YciA
MNSTEIEQIKNNEFICRNSQFCKGKEIGVHGRMFGGNLMQELDVVCAVFAAEIIDNPWIVTKTMNIEFVAPILSNQIYKVYVKLEHIGNTSLKILAEIRKHSVHTGKDSLAVKAESIFVRINEEGESIKISDHIKKRFGFIDK